VNRFAALKNPDGDSVLSIGGLVALVNGGSGALRLGGEDLVARKGNGATRSALKNSGNDDGKNESGMRCQQICRMHVRNADVATSNKFGSANWICAPVEKWA
jgi:hypothetical protein